MTDVFISYARVDQAYADRVAQALKHEGFAVWYDEELPAHRAYSEVIEERLKAAKAVIVLWSAEAARSQWVRAEADAARGAGTLVQTTLDGTIPPLPFNQIQCADLCGWDGNVERPGWRKVATSVRLLTGRQEPVEPQSHAAPPAPSLSVCVLPFENMSGDAEQEYFSDGISEDITTDLSQISALNVVARNTAFAFKSRAADVKEIRRTTGASHVLEGSVRKAAQRVRITSQLIDVATGGQIWAHRFDRDLEDIFAIQDEISKSIVRVLKLKLMPLEEQAIEQRDTTSAAAYNLYLLARQYWVTGNEGDIRREERVMRICSRAVEIDSYYGRAWALLAMAQSNLRYAFRADVDDGFAAAHTALVIDPTIAEAHIPMIRRLEDRQDFQSADSRIEEALRLDDTSWEVCKEAARIYIRQGRLEEAAAQLEKAVAAIEGDFHGWARLVSVYHALGDEAAMKIAGETAIRHAEAALSRNPSNGSAMSYGALACAAVGQHDRAREWMERALLIDPYNLSLRYTLACTHAAYLGEGDAALELLRRSLSSASAFHVMLAGVEPDLASLRGDARFATMLSDARARLGVGDATAANATN